MKIVIDIEADSLNPTVIWVVVTKDIDTNEVLVWKDAESLKKYLAKGVDLCVGHNIIHYDLQHLSRLWGIEISQNVVRDTLVLSHLYDYRIEGGHSLDAWGKRLGVRKFEFNDFSKLTPAMIDYCIQDVELNTKLWKYLRKYFADASWSKSIIMEHKLAYICVDMQNNGIYFDKAKANNLYDEIKDITDALDKEILAEFKPVQKLDKEFEIRYKKDGTPTSKTQQLLADPNVKRKGSKLLRYRWEEFNPQSSKQINERLYGHWEPTDKTDAHAECKDRTKLKYFSKYGWKINEANMNTLKETAPEGAKLLVQRILLGARLRQLTTWLEAINWQITITKTESTENIIKEIVSIIKNTKKNIEEKIKNTTQNTIKNIEKKTTIKKEIEPIEKDTEYLSKTTIDFLKNKITLARSVEKAQENSVLTIVMTPGELEEYFALDATLITNGSWRINPTFNSIGTWTHRLSSVKPNVQNIAAKKTIKYNSGQLRELAIKYGGEFRGLFQATPGKILVGTDMEGAHLRLFAHFINDKAFIDALVSGSKELGTDPHSLTKQIIGELCPDRDRAKTFIFTFLNGGGVQKVSEIFACSIGEAREILDDFIGAYPGLRRLKEETFVHYADLGYFVGIDGRKIKCDSAHLMMAGYLQSGEKIIMGHANVLWRDMADKQGLKYKQINICHDEFLCECDPADADILGEIQCKAIRMTGEQFKLNCPLAGETKLGRTWLEAH